MAANRRREDWARRAFVALAALAFLYGLVSYALLPAVWRHFEGHERMADLPLTTQTALGLPGDPLNVALEGSEDDVICALTAAGWAPADATTIRSSLKIAGSVIFDQPYRNAPVSALLFDGRKQDLAFQKAAGRSADTRHHVRFWRALEAQGGQPQIWVGSVTFDRGVGLSGYTGQVTHHIDADVDAERDALTHDLVDAGVAQAISQVSGVGPTVNARNGGGDVYFTDGEMSVVRLAADCKAVPQPPALAQPSALIRFKNWAFALFAALRRRL